MTEFLLLITIPLNLLLLNEIIIWTLNQFTGTKSRSLILPDND